MSLRLSLFVVLAAAGCAKQAPQARAPQPMFDLSRICTNPHYGQVCAPDVQAPSSLPASSPIRVDTNLSAPRSTKLAVQG